ncbi:Rieske 2Fe-2S domain-containing protein [Sulfolobus sp. E5-1-F]|uniref:aromatic ring-hydroxylating oxygenase subunit alpha n=1 Tax=Saccharolobus sp. E5-1-F TaxID=2663019 RepID=UPI0012974C3E|nr:SRPBCC family protein [Sulfolobus sp. E5-1-F]QGA54002.1 Rieske 2Fe-2S domain-containing protein [Sulfolobus sp. E5-1-F]
MQVKEKIRNILDDFQPEKGQIPLSLFIDQDIYDLELATVFRKSWLFLGFDSMISHAGDYFTTTMGEAPVIVTRDQNNQVRVFLNFCIHKGMRVCRATQGNSSFFRCPYHGWTFDNTGKLVGVPYFDPGYAGILEKDKLGLIQIPNIKVYKGTIWASLDEKPIPFEDFLGDMKLYLDLILDMFEGNLEVYGGIHRWLIPVNWKIPLENFAGDAYHAPFTHASTIPIGLRTGYPNNVRIIYPGNGHGIVSVPSGVSTRKVADIEGLRPYRERLEKAIEVLSQRYGEFVKNMFPFGPLNVFPNFSLHFTWNYLIFHIWHPRGPTQTEVHGGLLIFSDLPEETKRQVLKRSLHEFGPAGLLEQDDAEVWSRITESGIAVRRHSINPKLIYVRGLGMDKSAEEVLGKGAKGIVGEYFSEVSLRGFYSTLKKYLMGEAQ